MCGIFGYFGYNNNMTLRQVIDIVISGLARLEYRGYDSAGIGFHFGSKLTVIKSVGAVSDLSDTISSKVLPSMMEMSCQCQCSIGHTRWATHGIISEQNAHPHVSNSSNGFIAVHNGNISRWAEIKAELIDKGYVFNSHTDTEIIPMLAQYFYDNRVEYGIETFPDIASKVMEYIASDSNETNHFSCLLLSNYFPQEMIAYKRGGPIIVGISNKDLENDSIVYYVSSDINSISYYCENAYFLKEGDMMHIDSKGKYKIYNNGDTKQDDNIFSIQQITTQSAELGNFDSYMSKEIHEQKYTVLRPLEKFEQIVSQKSAQMTLEKIKNDCNRIILVGCGTSFHACMAVREIMEELCNIPINIELASDFLDRNPLVKPSDTVILVSQSGETADTLYALNYCKLRKATCLAVTNNSLSSLALQSELNFEINAGVEVGVASTKAYTSQIVTMILIATKLAGINKAITLSNIADQLSKLPQLVAQTLKLENQIKSIAKEHVDSEKMLIIGRGYQFATCREAALKIKEISYIHCEGIYAGELKHGSLALVDSSMPIIMVISRDSMYAKMHSAYQQVIARKGKPIVICPIGDECSFPDAKKVIAVNQTMPAFQSIVNIIPLQLMALHLAKERGLNVDRPRNLAKSVTVTD